VISELESNGSAKKLKENLGIDVFARPLTAKQVYDQQQ
jgi:hypothetical protein